MSDVKVGSDTVLDLESIGDVVLSLASSAADMSPRLLLRRLDTEIAALSDIAARLRSEMMRPDPAERPISVPETWADRKRGEL